MIRRIVWGAVRILSAVLLFCLLAVASFLICRSYFTDSLTETDLKDASELTSFGVTMAGEKALKEAASASVEAVALDEEIRILLDPGHGFGDPGCESDLLVGTEAEVVLEITLLLKEKLESLGATVYLSHDGHTFPAAAELTERLQGLQVQYKEDKVLEDGYYSPYERAMYAESLHNMCELDLFLSLHINSLPESPEIHQCELYYCGENPGADSLGRLTQRLQETFSQETKIEASGYDEAFITTKYASCPSLLMEIGYATNPQDAANLNDQLWRDSFCRLLAEELVEWAKTER